jgi:hypothetical protein
VHHAQEPRPFPPQDAAHQRLAGEVMGRDLDIDRGHRAGRGGGGAATAPPSAAGRTAAIVDAGAGPVVRFLRPAPLQFVEIGDGLCPPQPAVEAGGMDGGEGQPIAIALQQAARPSPPGPRPTAYCGARARSGARCRE